MGNRKKGKSYVSGSGVLIYDHKDLYSGFAEINLKSEQTGLLDKIYIDGFLDAGLLDGAVRLGELYPNQCCRINFDKKCVLALYKKKDGRFNLARKEKDFQGREIKPINEEQAFAYALLSDPQIELVTLVGKAGTGKTLMSLLAGYGQLEKLYEQLLIYRPNIELGQKLGFLPGEKNEKFALWMPPVLDNLNLIVKEDKKKISQKYKMSEKDGNFSRVKELIYEGFIDIEPINYIRGRSLHQKFVIVDEAQNFDKHEIKTIITRAGKNTKMVLTGDISQIDNHKVDARSNGLSHVINRFKGQEFFGHIILRKSERSPLAELAANLL